MHVCDNLKAKRINERIFDWRWRTKNKKRQKFRNFFFPPPPPNSFSSLSFSTIYDLCASYLSANARFEFFVRQQMPVELTLCVYSRMYLYTCTYKCYMYLEHNGSFCKPAMTITLYVSQAYGCTRTFVFRDVSSDINDTHSHMNVRTCIVGIMKKQKKKKRTCSEYWRAYRKFAHGTSVRRSDADG